MRWQRTDDGVYRFMQRLTPQDGNPHQMLFIRVMGLAGYAQVASGGVWQAWWYPIARRLPFLLVQIASGVITVPATVPEFVPEGAWRGY